MKLAAKFGYVLVVIFTITFFSPVFAQATEWSQSKNKKGVQVFIRHFTGSNIDEFLSRCFYCTNCIYFIRSRILPNNVSGLQGTKSSFRNR